MGMLDQNWVEAIFKNLSTMEMLNKIFNSWITMNLLKKNEIWWYGLFDVEIIQHA